MLIISLIMTAIICLSMIGFGLLMVKKPPKEINALFGYRTAMHQKTRILGILHTGTQVKYGLEVGLSLEP
ncbi:hypothetical protein EDC18_101430 [Natranaerovirga pectinivora]|uniref:Uncharacterized protein n=1 Tax=Natranaerovirga pectinivora TaxID=682400 RepID=A0A4R3MQG8_9FIRM|nr:hypothetical protein [Natranaerovirga pectinivora]TCT17132.1 hypothetical protein EDC18_101430 [Natranaerovirga pectinivora]